MFPKLSTPEKTFLVATLQSIAAGYIYGYTVRTVYPAMRRLERDALIRFRFEDQSIAGSELRPARKYYMLTRSGEAALEAARKRYPLLAKVAAGLAGLCRTRTPCGPSIFLAGREQVKGISRKPLRDTSRSGPEIQFEETASDELIGLGLNR